MEIYNYIPFGICANQISFGLEDGKIHYVSFIGGCPGNSQIIGKLLEGQDVKRAIKILKGIRCGNKPTSCPDQLAIALENALQQNKAG